MFETITWLVTNKCGLNCKYCSFAHRLITEASIEDKIKVLEHFKTWPEWEKRFICLLGGDIIYMDDIGKFAKALNDLDLYYGFQSSCNDYKQMDKLINEYDLKNLSISVDPVDMSSYSRTKKAMKGIFWSGYIKALNKDIDIHATLTLDRKNIAYAPQTVEILSDLGIWCEITSVHWKKPNFDLVPEKQYVDGFTEADLGTIELVMNKLVKMKEDGYLIHSTKKFLKSWKDYVVNLSWRCENPVNVVVDADLSMRMCLHAPGKRVRKWNILDLTYDRWSEFLEDWKADQKELCPNCFWDCQLEIMNQDMDEVEKWFNHEK